jgi:hypothetical protein
MSKYRNFTFTYNNYPDTTLVDTIECKYIIYAKEIGESGTPHLQGFITYLQPKTLSASIKALPGCHVEIAKTLAPAIAYCKKTLEYTERGRPPLEPKEKGLLEKTRWKRILEAAQKGEFTWLEQEEPQVSLIHDRALERAHKKAKKTIPQTLVGDTLHQWNYGPPGTGKSWTAREENPGAYIKDPKSIWWDSYNGEATVIIDDFDKYQVSQGGDLKRWLDRYPFQAQYKGGSELIRPEKIVVTSNYHPKDIWEDPITCAAISRRVKVTHFPDKTPFNYSGTKDTPGIHPSFNHPEEQ